MIGDIFSIKKNEEKLFNISVGISIISWGIIGGYKYVIGNEYSNVRLITSIFNCYIGILFLVRRPILKDGSLISFFFSLPSFILGGMIFKLARPHNLWLEINEFIFALGALFALISFLFLGKNFSIFPSLREISTKGPYRLVRHPAYFGETLMVIACLLSCFDFVCIILFILFFASLLMRIEQEEKLLSITNKYQIYKNEVRWKLIPFVF